MNALEPYVGAIKAIVIVLLALGLFGTGHHFGAEAVQAKWNADKLLQAQATQKAEAAARAKEQSMTKQLEDARNEATKRETAIRADADAARRSADSLRDQLAANKRAMSSAAADAVRQYADTLADVFSECAARYTSVAEEADRHASDKRTLMEAWPR